MGLIRNCGVPVLIIVVVVNVATSVVAVVDSAVVRKLIISQ